MAYKIQVMEQRQWQANTVLNFNLEQLVDRIDGSPLHVVEVIIALAAEVNNPSEAQDREILPQMIGVIDLIPNNTCEASHVDGDSAYKLDWALTGRRQGFGNIPVDPVDPQSVSVAVRLPFHGCLLGGKSGEYSDLISPVRRWWRGNVQIRTTDAVPFSDMEIVSGTYKVVFVTEPYPDGYHIGPNLMYDLWSRPSGVSFTFPSKGRMAFLGLSPLDKAGSAAYADFIMRDACWVEGIDARTLIYSWLAMQGFGGLNDDFGGPITDLGIVPLVFNRPCNAKMWTLPYFGEGNKTVEAPNNTSELHRVITAQVAGSRQYVRQAEADVGRKAIGPKLRIKDGADAIRAAIARGVLPRTIAKYALNKKTGALREIAR